MNTSRAPDGERSQAKTRRAARRLALDVLYEAEIRDSLPMEAFGARRLEGWVVPSAAEHDALAPPPEEAPTEEVLDYAQRLCAGVQEFQAQIDEVITGHAARWDIMRMPVIDRNLLRIALFELLHDDDVPVAVAINEAVELAKDLSTEDSGRFVNGLLGRVAEELAD